MLDPALRLQARVHLYPLMPDLRPDLPALEALLDRGGAVALLATHFFAMRQDWTALLEICQRHAVAVIEDCSHCLPAQAGVNALGTIGRYSVWSPYKFYPCEDGGLLQANGGAGFRAGPGPQPPLLEELKGVHRLIARSRKSDKALDPAAVDATLATFGGAAQTAGFDLPESQAEPSDQYDAALEERQPLRASRWLTARSGVGRIAARRRSRYAQWQQACAALPNCHALYPALPDDCVPYMFPLHIDRPERHFMPLKLLGMPAWRWDNMGDSDCKVAQDYRLRLLHLPCHQELSDAEFDWMVRVVSAVLSMR